MSNYQTFTLDTQSAKQADAGGRIDQSGKYVGTIVSMEFITAKSGTQGFEISFETEAKEYARLNIYTQKSDGTKLSGFKQINALLTCAGVRTLTPTQQTLEKYDFESKQRIKQPCVVAPEIQNKKIGLLLQREEYLNGNNEPRSRMSFFSCFNPSNELMAGEIIGQKTRPEALPKILERLMQLDSQNHQQQSYQAPQNQGYGQAPQQGGYNQQPRSNQQPSQPQSADLDDSLPF